MTNNNKKATSRQTKIIYHDLDESRLVARLLRTFSRSGQINWLFISDIAAELSTALAKVTKRKKKHKFTTAPKNACGRETRDSREQQIDSSLHF